MGVALSNPSTRGRWLDMLENEEILRHIVFILENTLEALLFEQVSNVVFKLLIYRQSITKILNKNLDFITTIANLLKEKTSSGTANKSNDVLGLCKIVSALSATSEVDALLQNNTTIINSLFKLITTVDTPSIIKHSCTALFNIELDKKETCLVSDFLVSNIVNLLCMQVNNEPGYHEILASLLSLITRHLLSSYNKNVVQILAANMERLINVYEAQEHTKEDLNTSISLFEC